MKRPVIALLILSLFSCKEISFKEPQPRGKNALSEIPPALRGEFLLSMENESSKDTLIVTATGYMTISDKKQNTLGDSLVLKYYKGYYFLSINENPEWLLRVFKTESNGDITYMTMDVEEAAFNSFVKDLSNQIQVDSIQVNGEKLYQIDPSPKEMMRLIRKGYFKKTIRMKKL